MASGDRRRAGGGVQEETVEVAEVQVVFDN
jgi:hypothetical protein